jgi:hypothetical protein
VVGMNGVGPLVGPPVRCAYGWGARRVACYCASMLWKRDTTELGWGRIAGVALLLAAGAYAVQHPHSFVYYVVKALVSPVPWSEW